MEKQFREQRKESEFNIKKSHASMKTSIKCNYYIHVEVNVEVNAKVNSFIDRCMQTHILIHMRLQVFAQ